LFTLPLFFSRFDADADGSISLKELKKVVNDIFHLLSNEDKETCKNKAALTLSAFKEMDTNADGMITEKEFLDAIMAQEKMATLLTLKIAQERGIRQICNFLKSWCPIPSGPTISEIRIF
jgi:hypothetical protein